MKTIKIVMCCLIICFTLISCNSKSEDTRYTGILANDEVVSSIRQEIQDKENSSLANEDHVFWSKSGKLWHSDSKCSYLANSKTVIHGTIEEARFEGKEKACDRCSSGRIDSFYEALENNDYKAGDVFFTKEGNIWHQNLNCVLIKSAEKVYYADVETAELLGKVTPCAECEN